MNVLNFILAVVTPDGAPSYPAFVPSEVSRAALAVTIVDTERKYAAGSVPNPNLGVMAQIIVTGPSAAAIERLAERVLEHCADRSRWQVPAGGRVNMLLTPSVEKTHYNPAANNLCAVIDVHANVVLP